MVKKRKTAADQGRLIFAVVFTTCGVGLLVAASYIYGGGVVRCFYTEQELACESTVYRWLGLKVVDQQVYEGVISVKRGSTAGSSLSGVRSRSTIPQSSTSAGSHKIQESASVLLMTTEAGEFAAIYGTYRDIDPMVEQIRLLMKGQLQDPLVLGVEDKPVAIGMAIFGSVALLVGIGNLLSLINSLLTSRRAG